MMEPLKPGDTIGILGGGQLGRMLALSAAQLGLRSHIYCPEDDCPASHVSTEFTKASYTDDHNLKQFASSVDRITFEFENIPLQTIDTVAQLKAVCPSRKALEVTQDRLTEKHFLASLGIQTASFAAIDAEADLEACPHLTSAGAILKTRRFGYDGKGQVRVKDRAQLQNAWNEISKAPAILEEIVPFKFEISVVGARTQSGETAFYDPPLNEHRNQILFRSTVPSPISESTRAQALEIAQRIADQLDYVGILAVEMFVIDRGSEHSLLVNEIAPRVHNTGHWTLDACVASQFENHIRAVCGWPLGTTERTADAEMTNLIGTDFEDWCRAAKSANTAVHLYGKNQVRPGRKMGHVTKLTSLTKGR